MAEYFRDDEHRDVLLLVDNIFRFIQPGMDVSGLPGQMPSLLRLATNHGHGAVGVGKSVLQYGHRAITSIRAV